MHRAKGNGKFIMKQTIHLEHKKQIDDLNESIQMLDTHYKMQKRRLSAQFGRPSADAFDAVRRFTELKQETQTARLHILAKMATHILMGHDIVWSNSYLHEHDLYHYMAQLPDSEKQIVATAWTQSGPKNTFGAIPAPYLHNELMYHKIVLLDTHYCMELCARIRDLTIAIQCHYLSPDNIINPIMDYERPLTEMVHCLGDFVPSLRQKCRTDDYVALAQLWLMKLREKLNQSERQ